MKNYSDNWGWWFSGLVDGEGCFTISTRRALFIPRFHMALRADDGAILKECNQHFPGSLIFAEPSEKVRADPHRSNTAPQYRWTVSTKKSLFALATHFQNFPLRTKKTDEVEYWQWAVWEYMKPPKQRNSTMMEEMRNALMACHIYDGKPYDVMLAKIVSPQLPMELD